MRPALEPGDWLLVDPTIAVWPKRGTIVVVRSPDDDLLTIKRVAARPGDVIRTLDGPIRLGPDPGVAARRRAADLPRLAGLWAGRARSARGARLVPLRTPGDGSAASDRSAPISSAPPATEGSAGADPGRLVHLEAGRPAILGEPGLRLELRSTSGRGSR